MINMVLLSLQTQKAASPHNLQDEAATQCSAGSRHPPKCQGTGVGVHATHHTDDTLEKGTCSPCGIGNVREMSIQPAPTGCS